MAFDMATVQGAAVLGKAGPDEAAGRRRLLKSHHNGASPWALQLAFADWWVHLSQAPDRLKRLALMATTAAPAILASSALAGGPDTWVFTPEKGDRRFQAPAWAQWPFSAAAQSHLAAEALMREATAPLPGLPEAHRRQVELAASLALGALSPGNFPWSNPEVLEAAAHSGGLNFVRGAALLYDDLARAQERRPPAGYDGWRLGDNIAATPGQVIYRNRLMELIQYAPAGATVKREPVLIVPAWIMKYYILDLTPEESLIRYLVEAGFSVFAISWKNPAREQSDLTFEDYRKLGVLEAMDAIARVTGAQRLHAVGYCLGGTLMAAAAAMLARTGDDRLASLTLLAAQTDFSASGPLSAFTTEKQLAALDDLMAAEGGLDGQRMAAAFYGLKANEMLWPRAVQRYLLGQAKPASALEYWLADVTQMPARMHSQYLRWMYLENRLARGEYEADGQKIGLKDIRCPLFVLGAEQDHIAPWRSVHRIELFARTERSFLLTGGGHNTSVVSPPGKPKAHYRMKTVTADAPYTPPEEIEALPPLSGSWWPAWAAWLSAKSSGEIPAPPMGRPESGLAPLCPAPGTYVQER